MSKSIDTMSRKDAIKAVKSLRYVGQVLREMVSEGVECPCADCGGNAKLHAIEGPDGEILVLDMLLGT